MTTNEQRLEKLRAEHIKYKQDLEELKLSIEESKSTSIAIDKKFARIQKKLDNSYNKILNIQEKIALELEGYR